MYDDAARGHWYDEPPYESDPDDFLMSGIGLDPAAATIQVSAKESDLLSVVLYPFSCFYCVDNNKLYNFRSRVDTLFVCVPVSNKD